MSCLSQGHQILFHFLVNLTVTTAPLMHAEAILFGGATSSETLFQFSILLVRRCIKENGVSPK